MPSPLFSLPGAHLSVGLRPASALDPPPHHTPSAAGASAAWAGGAVAGSDADADADAEGDLSLGEVVLLRQDFAEGEEVRLLRVVGRVRD